MPFDNPPVPVVQDTEITRTLVHGYHRILNGWCRRKLYNDRGEYCAVGALHLFDRHLFDADTTRWSWWNGPEVKYLWAALPDRKLPLKDDGWLCYSRVVNYNNDPQTTKDDILHLYERAITLSREQVNV